MKYRLLLMASLIGIAAPATAEWEFSRWGMTVDQAVEASSGAATAVRAEKDKRVFEFDRLAAGKWLDDGINYDMSLFFTRKKKTLTLVTLVPAKEDCDRMIASFTSRYGSALTGQTNLDMGLGKPPIVNETRKWAHPDNSDAIQISDVSVKEFNIRYCKALIQPGSAPE